MKIKNAVSDDFTIAKLHYFSYIAGLLQQFLIRYQTDQPLHPFLLDEILSIQVYLRNQKQRKSYLV